MFRSVEHALAAVIQRSLRRLAHEPVIVRTEVPMNPSDPDSKRKLALSALVFLRLAENGLNEDEIRNIPEEVLEEMLDEKTCWVIRRGPDICADCGRLKARVLVTHHTHHALGRLFP